MSDLYLDDGDIKLYHGDCIQVMRDMPDASIDAIVTDPPYELGFMGKSWDESGIAYNVEMWREALRVLKSGGHLLSFGGTRTYHRMTCAIEDAGFEIRDCIQWLYGSGFPKSMDVSKAIDKAAGAEREIVGSYTVGGTAAAGGEASRAAIASGTRTTIIETKGLKKEINITAPATDAAKQYDGWGTALKPANEPIVLARKPFTTTVAENVLQHGVGGLNIDACRIGEGDSAGRFPANIIFDEAAAAILDTQSGHSTTPETVSSGASGKHGKYAARDGVESRPCFGDSGGASRFFYVAKPSREERDTGLPDGNFHPTVKPVTLMQYLVRLVTPVGGVVLDPFAGSGTTLLAARNEGMNAIGIELTEEYLPIIAGRLSQQTLC